MSIYKHRPTEVTAVEWNGNNIQAVLNISPYFADVQRTDDKLLRVWTGYCYEYVPVGYWVVRSNESEELIVLSPEIFNQAYELVSPDSM